MESLTLEERISLLYSSIRFLRHLRYEGIDSTAVIEQAKSKVLELERQAGWHCVSPIRNGSATESIYCGKLEDCKNFVSVLLKEHPEDKGNIIITPL